MGGIPGWRPSARTNSQSIDKILERLDRIESRLDSSNVTSINASTRKRSVTITREMLEQAFLEGDDEVAESDDQFATVEELFELVAKKLGL